MAERKKKNRQNKKKPQENKKKEIPVNELKKKLSKLKKKVCPTGYSKMKKDELIKMSEKYDLPIDYKGYKNYDKTSKMYRSMNIHRDMYKLAEERKMRGKMKLLY